MLYVCDRQNNRIQVFQKDGTFVQEAVIATSKGFGAVHAIGFSPEAEQRFLYVGDGANKKVWILRRETLETVGSFGRGGRAGGQFLIVHALAVDAQGNVYVGGRSTTTACRSSASWGCDPSPSDGFARPGAAVTRSRNYHVCRRNRPRSPFRTARHGFAERNAAVSPDAVAYAEI